MAFPILEYNATTGDDTNSGSPGSITPITLASTGVGVTATNGTSTITFDSAVDLTGTLDDDSDVFWCVSTTGERHLFRITAFNGTYPTAVTSLTVAETVGATNITNSMDWAIGGRRQTLVNDTSNIDSNDVAAGWVLEFDEGTYTLPDNVVITTQGADLNNPEIWRAKAGIATRPNIHYAYTITNVRLINLGTDAVIHFIGLHFSTANTNTAGTCIYAIGGADQVYIINCELEGAHSGTGSAILDIGSNTQCIFINNWIHGSGTSGMAFTGRGNGVIMGNVIDGVERNGIGIGITSPASASITSRVFINNIIINCNTIGLQMDGSSIADHHVAINNTIYNCGTDGLNLLEAASDSAYFVYNNILYNNGAYGANCASQNAADQSYLDFNAYGGNGAGDLNTTFLTAGDNDISLTADPILDAASNNFTLNNEAGGGALCREASFPTAYTWHNNITSTTSYGDIGAVQAQDGGAIMASGDTLLTLPATSGTPPATRYATLDTVADSSVANVTHMVLDFDPGATTEFIDFVDTMPGQYDGTSSIDVVLEWTSANTAAVNTKWDVSFKSITPETDNVEAKAFATIQSITDAVAATSRQTVSSSITFTNAEADSVQPNEMFILRVERDSLDAADTMTEDDAELHKVEVRMT